MNREEVITTLRNHEQELRRRGVLHAGLFEYVGITQYLSDLYQRP